MMHDRGARRLIVGAHLGGVIICALLGATIWKSVQQPLSEQVVIQESTVRKLGRQVKTASVENDAVATLEKELKTLEESTKLAKERIPARAEEAELLEQVSLAAQEVGVTIQDYSRGEVTTTDTYSRFKVILKGVGSFEGICRLVDHLYRLPRISTVERLQIQSPLVAKASASESGPVEVYPIALTLVLYFGSDAAEAEERS